MAYLFHIVLGMTIFLLFPFSRLVHVWSGFASIGYLFRPYQVVRSRRLNVPAGHNLPRRSAAGGLKSRRSCSSRLTHSMRSPASTAWRCTRRGRDDRAGTLRQRACTELLRQAAQRAGLLAADDAPAPTARSAKPQRRRSRRCSSACSNVPEPSDEACRRHYAAHASAFATGERVRVRHILFAVTPGVDVVALRKRAETTLLDVRCHDGKRATASPPRRASCPTARAARKAAIWAG